MMTQQFIELTKELILSAMRKVTSADKAYALFREEDLPFTRKEVRAKWREVGEKDMWATVYETYGTDKKPPRAWVIEQQSKEATGYHYVYGVRYFDFTTHEEYTETHSRRTTDLLPLDTVLSDYEDEEKEYAVAKGAAILGYFPAGIIKYIPKK